MKRYLVLFVCILAAAALSYTLTRQLMPAAEEDQLTWLQREFHLTAAQIASVSQLQDAYQPICAEHCRLIQEANHRPGIEPAEIARLEQICQEATIKHLREIAAVMPSNEGSRFLALVEPKVSRHEHQGPLGLK